MKANGLWVDDGVRTASFEGLAREGEGREASGGSCWVILDLDVGKAGRAEVGGGYAGDGSRIDMTAHQTMVCER